MKRQRLVILLLLLLPLIPVGWLLATESGLRWAYQLASPYLPSGLGVQQVSGKLIGPMTLTDIEYTHDGVRLRSPQIIFDWQLSALLTATIDINDMNVRALDIELPSTTQKAPSQATTQDTALPALRLPMRIKFNDAVIDGINITRDDQHYSLKSLRLDTGTMFKRIRIRQLSVEAERFGIELSGELEPVNNYPHTLKIDWHTLLPSGATLKGKGEIEGDTTTTHVTQQLSGALQLALNGRLHNLLTHARWQANVDARYFDLVQIENHLPALSGALKFEGHGDYDTASISGTLDGNTPDTGAFDAHYTLQRQNNTIQIERLTLHSSKTDTQLNANGQWIPASNGGDVKLALDWKNLRYPITRPGWFNSARGNGSIEGNLDRYRVTLDCDSPWPAQMPSTWTASASGNRDGMDFESLHVRALDGDASATGKLSWSPVLNWKAEASAQNINPVSLLPAWPGQLQAKLGSTGRYENDRLVIDADIRKVDGTLRKYPVSLRSRLQWNNDELNIQTLTFDSGKSRFTVKGSANSTLKLDWTIASDHLGELYPGADGQLHAQGQLGGSRDKPEISASFNGKAIKLPQLDVGVLRGTLAVDLFQWQRVDLKLHAQSLKLSGTSLHTLDITGSSRHMQAKAVSALATTDIELEGKADSNGWRGQLVKASVQSQRYDHWQLRKPVALTFGETTFNAGKMCWQSDQHADVCATLEKPDSSWHSSLEATRLPLRILNPWLPPDLTLEGVVNANAELQFQAPDQLSGHAHIELPPGVVNYPLLEGEHEHWEYRSGKLDITLDSQALKADADIAMNSGDRFHGSLALPGVNLLALDIQHQHLQASTQLTIHDLGIIEALVPEVQDPVGEITMNLDVTGTLAQPRLNGRARLADGSLRIPRLGLNIEQLAMNAHSEGFENISFSLDAHSGDGNIAVKGSTLLDSQAGWPTDISIKGEAVEVSRIPEAHVQVTPDLHLKLQHRTVDISGSVHIPAAKLQPRDITTAAHVSDDAVIIGGEQVDEQKWSIVSRVRLTLGDRVNFYGFGFEGRFGGSLLLEDEPGQLTRATGEITVPEGRYRAYGQRLDVERGRVIFTGGPLTNPGLDLSAVRHVNNVTAGLRVRGNLKQPELELFSVPTMGETDALAYLVLGRPIENASSEEGAMMAKATLALGLSGGDRVARLLGDKFGLDEMRVESSDSGDQASLVVGRYLSPKIYVSYGVGLIEAVNTLTVRYQISDKWQLKAESGEAQGADILYTFEH